MEANTISQSFRDSLSTVDEKGKRIWVYPKKPKGKLHNLRILVSIVLLSVLFIGPFIKINGHPLLLLNFFERKFVILGAVFWPQDTHLLIFVLLIFFVFIILFTVAFGRVWCGWACPQTIFMEMVFRKIEYWIEGDANQQRKLNTAVWNREKTLKKGAKHLIFLLISLVIAHTLMAYLIGIEQVKEIVSTSPAENLSGFMGLIFFTGIFYGVFAFLREQACTVICPYGRLQGVLLDKNSIVVAYDWLRGEPRGKLRKKVEEAPKGDCIDCSLCVQVCPTGIDIRNGTQLECVNCTACIDACDEVMLKVNRPKGLIRFDSYNGIAEKKKLKFSPRIIGYSVILMALMVSLGFLLFNRSPIEAHITRVPGMMYQEQPDNKISNLYNVQLVNKTFDPVPVDLRLKDNTAEITIVGEGDLTLPGQAKKEITFFILLKKDQIKKSSTPVVVQIFSGEELMDEIETRFLGPVKNN
jgi:cytochrome c oxidase accessory protein FixG